MAPLNITDKCEGPTVGWILRSKFVVRRVISDPTLRSTMTLIGLHYVTTEADLSTKPAEAFPISDPLKSQISDLRMRR